MGGLTVNVLWRHLVPRVREELISQMYTVAALVDNHGVGFRLGNRGERVDDSIANVVLSHARHETSNEKAAQRPPGWKVARPVLRTYTHPRPRSAEAAS